MIDLRQNKVLRSVRIGRDLTGLTLSPNGRTLYASNACFGVDCGPSFFAIDARTLDVVYSKSLAGAGQAVAISPDGKVLYVAHSSAQSATNEVVSVVNLTTKAAGQSFTVATFPAAMTVSPNGQSLYVAGNSGADNAGNIRSELRAINVANGMTKIASQGSAMPCSLATDPTGRYVYESFCAALPGSVNFDTGVRVYDAYSWSNVATVDIPGGARGLAVSRTAAVLYAASATNNRVNLISTETNTVMKSFQVRTALGSVFQDLATGPNNAHLYATNFNYQNPNPGIFSIING